MGVLLVGTSSFVMGVSLVRFSFFTMGVLLSVSLSVGVLLRDAWFVLQAYSAFMALVMSVVKVLPELSS